MHRLVGLEAHGTGFVDAMRQAWDRGDAVLPIDPRLPRPAAARLRDALRVGEVVEPGTALVMPTSGTTGTPKGVVLSHDAVRASAVATSTRLAVDPARHRWLACLPLAHVGGLSVVTRALHTDTPFEVHDGFDAAAVEEAAAECTHVSLVSTALARIDATRWTTIVLGGAAALSDPPPNSVTTYGLTETGSGVVYDGRPLDDVEVRIEADGEILLRGPMIATTYRDGRPVVDEEAWLHTGDVGTFVDGRLAVAGRRDDMIITGGENVWPEVVEARLRTHPAVVAVGVVGRPDPEWGQSVTAVVVPTDPASAPTLDDLRDWVRTELPVWCAPRQLELRTQLPTTALGKVRRHLL